MADAGIYLFKSGRLGFRPLGETDAGPHYVAWMNDPAVVRFLEARHQRQSAEDVRAFVARQAARDDTLFLGVFLLADGRHIGNVKLAPIVRRHARAEMGILIGARDCWGRGYGAEAISAVAAHAFSELGIGKITAGCYGSNLASKSAFAKAGFATEGVRPAQYDLNGAWDDEIVMGLLRPGRAGGGKIG